MDLSPGTVRGPLNEWGRVTPREELEERGVGHLQVTGGHLLSEIFRVPMSWSYGTQILKESSGDPNQTEYHTQHHALSILLDV